MALVLTTFLALCVQFYAGVMLRGLYADGAFFVTHIAAKQGLCITQPARSFSQLLTQWPVVVGMWLGKRSLYDIALGFSLSTNIMPGLFILVACFVLPSKERALAVFPVFIYFATILASQFASVTEGLVATAYFWLLLTLVAYGSFSLSHKIIVSGLALGCLRMQEGMIFLGPLLFLACLLRWKRETCLSCKVTLYFVALCGLASTVVAVGYAFYPVDAGERSSFLGSFLAFKWVYNRGWLSGYGGVNLCAILGVMAVISIIIMTVRPLYRWTVFYVFLAASFVAAVSSFVFPALVMPLTQFDARHNPTLFTVPAGILYLMMNDNIRLRKAMTARPVVGLVCALGVSVSIWHIAATREWVEFSADIAEVLETHQGLIPWESVLKTGDERQQRLLWSMSFPWTNPDFSLEILRRQSIDSIIVAPKNYYGWKPYDEMSTKTMPAIPGVIYTYKMF
ncbi:MAG: hypothetical protein ABF785_12445 [Acetobacter papayae]|uniref:hypothetical protein n=1 Tax=Acetobacter papayae TaxID=1076592 RepID=UPI0039EC6228